MTKKLTVKYNGVTFTEGDKVRIVEADCGNATSGEICTLYVGSRAGRCKNMLFARNDKTQGDGCYSPTHWQLLPKKSQPRNKDGKFAGKEAKKPDMGKDNRIQALEKRVTELEERLLADPECTTPFTSDGNREPAPKEAWRPEDGKDYHYVHMDSAGVRTGYFTCWNDNTDNEHFKSNNCFKTRAEAELVAEEVKSVFLKHKNL